MSLLIYRDGRVEEVEIREPRATEVGWLHLESPEAEVLTEVLRRPFHCHPLVIEDAIHFRQRPKVDHYPDAPHPQALISYYVFGKDLRATELLLIVSERYLISIVREPSPVLDRLYREVSERPYILESTGTLLYHLLDRCTDASLVATDRLEERVDQLEKRVFDHPERTFTAEIFHLKRQLHRLRRLAMDCTHVLAELTHEAIPFTNTDHRVYYVDVHDHAVRVADTFDSVRETLSGLLELQAAQRSNRMNQVMKTLTIFSTIFLPLSFITGVYGMNFRNMPELEWRYGYVYVLCLLAGTAAALIIYFRRKGWW
jgi:magnesium transporter